MLVKSGAKVADCYRKAAEAREKSKRAKTAEDQVFHAEMEGKWIRLAESYSFTERTQTFMGTRRRQSSRGEESYVSSHENRLIAALSPVAIALLRPALKEIELDKGTVLSGAARAGQTYFPRTGVICLLAMTTGSAVEVGVVGPSSVFHSDANGIYESSVRAVVRFAGSFSMIPSTRLASIAAQSDEIRRLLVRASQLRLAEAWQIAACNAVHDARARVCRVLLQYQGCVGTDLVPITQEEISQAIGVSRTTVSGITEALKAAKIIDYKRGKIAIRDHVELRKAACECHQTILDGSEPARL